MRSQLFFYSSARRFIVLTIGVTMLIACSPHPSAGKWKAISDNELGIRDIDILYEGKAEFTTTKGDVAVWHCFWGGTSKLVATMNCVPSSDTDRREQFTFVVDGSDQGKLSHQGELLATLERQSYE